jgi:hypothetical protein
MFIPIDIETQKRSGDKNVDDSQVPGRDIKRLLLSIMVTVKEAI